LSPRWRHLVRRFFWSLRVQELSATEIESLRPLRGEELLAVYLTQPAADQRHGLDCARWVEERGGRAEVAVAALVHDLGKRHAGLGVIGRSLASMCEILRLPAPGRLGRYLEHGRLGADDLAVLGAPRLVVDFARSHHGERPASIDPADWTLLVESDSVVVGRDGRAG
jgi:hypothetical protein